MPINLKRNQKIIAPIILKTQYMEEKALTQIKNHIIFVYAKGKFSAQIVSRETLFLNIKKLQWTKKIYLKINRFCRFLKNEKSSIKSQIL